MNTPLNTFPDAATRRRVWEERVAHALAVGFSGRLIIHATYCDDEPCTCMPYVVKRHDPRTAGAICEAAERLHRDN